MKIELVLRILIVLVMFFVVIPAMISAKSTLSLVIGLALLGGTSYWAYKLIEEIISIIEKQ